MPRFTGLTKIFVYILTGFLFSLGIMFIFLVPAGKLSSLDILRFFLSPGLIALIAATFGAWIGTKSNVKASQTDLAQTFLSLLDLMKEDIRINLRLMAKVQEQLRMIRAQSREPGPHELVPESAHTMFFEEIEFHKLRQLTPANMITDIFNVRNMRYVFQHWNDVVAKYYRESDPLTHREAQREVIEHLSAESPDSNFITACKQALDSIDLMQANIMHNVLKSV